MQISNCYTYDVVGSQVFSNIVQTQVKGLHYVTSAKHLGICVYW